MRLELSPNAPGKCASELVAQSCLTLYDLMDCSQPGFSVHGILQARILEWVAMPSSRGSSRPKDRTHVSCVSCVGGEFFTTEPLKYSSSNQKAHKVQKRMGVGEILLSILSILLPNSDMS